ncbi:hypothetical protein D3C73_1321310 [compost metagenome]
MKKNLSEHYFEIQDLELNAEKCLNNDIFKEIYTRALDAAKAADIINKEKASSQIVEEVFIPVLQ